MANMVLVNIGMHGHVNPTLGLARALVDLGHQLSFFSTAEFAESIRETGAEFVAYPSVLGQRTAQTATLQAAATEKGEAPPPEASAMARFIEELSLTLPNLKAEIERRRPDLVIYDFVALAAKLVADQLDIPTLKFFTTYASNEHFNLLRESFAKHDYPTPERLSAVQSAINRSLAAVGYDAIDFFATISKIDTANIVFMPKSFQPFGTTFDERFLFVGPCFRPAVVEAALPLLPQGDGPLLLISLGSLFHEWPEFYHACFSAFGASPWRIVMSIGTRLQLEDLGPIPANFSILPHIPQLDLLQLADVFITHGGMNSTMESLAHGVPMVVIPQIEEQRMTAQRIQEMDLGRYLRRSEVNAGSLAKAVNEVFNDAGVKGRARGFQKEIAEAGGPQAAAAWAQSLCQSRLPRRAETYTAVRT